MLVCRCAILMVELDSQPRFDLADLLAGGGGVVNRPRWLGRAPHLDEPVVLDLGDIALLEALPDQRWVARESLEAEHGALRVEGLLRRGLLLGDTADFAELRERDASYREVPWWPPAAVAHAQGRWTGNDVERRRAEGRVLPGA